MSWFGFGGSDKEDKPTGGAMKIDDFDTSHSTHFDNTPSFASSGGGTSSGGSFEQQMMMEQQKAVIQAVMFKLTESAFDSCVTKPTSSLSFGERSCIGSVVGKYLDTSELVVGRMQAGQQ